MLCNLLHYSKPSGIGSSRHITLNTTYYTTILISIHMISTILYSVNQMDTNLNNELGIPSIYNVMHLNVRRPVI